MKNPRKLLTAGDLERADAALLASASRVGPILAPVAGTDGTDKKGDKKGNEDLKAALQYLKFQPETIELIDKLATAASKLASIANWVAGTASSIAGVVKAVIAAIKTIKEILAWLGLIHPDVDKTQQMLEDIKVTVHEIYEFLEKTNVQVRYQQTEKWRIALNDMRTAVQDLGTSRSPANINDMRRMVKSLKDSIMEMLGQGYAMIPFARTVYQYPEPSLSRSSHWIDAATDFYMTWTDPAPPPRSEVSYADPLHDHWIWDPGYYLELLVASIELWITAFAITEPGFRSTGYRREDLRQIYNDLGTFIQQWENSMLETRIVGPLEPGVHRIFSPFNPYGGATGIPMGVIDPVSGVAAFEPNYNQGFLLVRSSFSPSDWFVANYSEAVATAYAYRAKLRATVHEACGINTLYRLRDNIFYLIVGPSRSEFVDLSPVQVRTRGPIRGVTPTLLEEVGHETATLGMIGDFAGAPGKIYPLIRYVQYTTDRIFRTSMAVRMDFSGIQLGYTLRLTISSMDDSQPPEEIELCPFSTEDGALFPTKPIVRILTIKNATVFDVYQSRPFSMAEEEEYENTGAVHGHSPGRSRIAASELPAERLFLNPRSGTVKIQVSVEFESPAQDPEKAFVGWAKVSVRSLEPNVFRDACILTLDVMETVIGTTGVDDPEMKRTQLADSMTLHLVPSFLVAPQDFFADRAKGLERMHAISGEIIQRYVRYQAPSVRDDPMHQVEATSLRERAVVTMFKQFREQFPEQEAALMQQFQSPTIKTGVGAH